VSSPGRFATPLDDVIARYPKGKPRADLSDVEALIRDRGIEPPAHRIVVIGTNGKTSTATYLARLFDAGGLRTGLTTSPHIDRWSERVRVAGEEVDDARLEAKVRELDEAGSGRDGLRFFDLITLAAAEIFVEDAVDVAVFEAGIGGRLDVTRCLRAPVVVLTSVDLDHTEQLGTTREAILAEKLGAAPPGAALVTADLGPDLNARVEALEMVEAKGAYPERNLALARAAARVAAQRFDLPDPSGLSIATDLPGRLHRLQAGALDVVVDAAHNEEGWREALAQTRPGFVAAVSISADRPAGVLAQLLAEAAPAAVVATCAWSGRSAAADDLASALAACGVPVTVEPDPARAVTLALEHARSREQPLLVFGSTYLLPHALRALRS
jgi:dihydrofolate synthase/folylpolyglutamate synthase